MFSHVPAAGPFDGFPILFQSPPTQTMVAVGQAGRQGGGRCTVGLADGRRTDARTGRPPISLLLIQAARQAGGPLFLSLHRPKAFFLPCPSAAQNHRHCRAADPVSQISPSLSCPFRLLLSSWSPPAVLSLLFPHRGAFLLSSPSLSTFCAHGRLLPLSLARAGARALERMDGGRSGKLMQP